MSQPVGRILVMGLLVSACGTRTSALIAQPGPSSPPPSPPSPPAAQAPPAVATSSAHPAVLRAVVHLSEGARGTSVRGLQNVLNALQALARERGEQEPAELVIVVHGQAVQWLRRGEPENLGPQVAAVLATGKVAIRVCQKSLDENHWRLEDLVPGPTVVPSGTLEVLRLEQQGYVYFRP